MVARRISVNKVLQAAGIAAKLMIPAFAGVACVILMTLMVAKTTIWSWILWMGALVFVFCLVWLIAYKNLK